MQEPWRIKLFGWLRAERGSQAVVRFPTQRTAALLAALAFRPGQPQPREVLTEMLWPDADPDAARNRFRVTLSTLRRLLEPDGVEAGSVVVADRATVFLRADALTTDVQEFECALASTGGPPSDGLAALARAVEAYRGELLPGFYENWIGPERARLSAAFVEALCRLSRAREEAGDISGAIEVAERAVSASPLREVAQQHLMELYLKAGEPSRALRQYRSLLRTLRRETGQPPAPETRALAVAVRARLREPAASAPSSVEGARSEAAPLEATRGADPAAARLPLPLTRFFGRGREVDDLVAMMTGAGPRLVTLTGPGGSGKTRLAIELARSIGDAFAGSLWFVPLAELDDAGLLPEAILAAVRPRHDASRSPMDHLASALGDGPALLVLDNFEHLVEGGTAVVRRLLEAAPGLRLLVTSQARLLIPGEHEVAVAPLEVPDPSPALDDLLACPSVRLFVDRAQAVQPTFQVTTRNAASVAVLCRKLEGIPLAIELAAAWSHALTPAQILDRLGRRFDLLVSRGHDAPARHSALRSALDWSFTLMEPGLQRFFARLSVFHNGWTLEAAEEVCGDPDAALRLATLRERSFIRSDEADSGLRFTMLETLREYAAEQLDPGDAAALARRHAAFYARLAEQAEPGLRGPAMAEWLDRLEASLDNLRAALEHELGPDGDHSAAARMCAELAMFWEHRGHFREGRGFYHRVLQAVAVPADRMPALNGAARLCACQGDADEAAAYAVEALALARGLDDPRGQALALRSLAFSAFIRADYTECIALQESAIALFRDLSDDWGLAATLDDLGSVLTRTGDYAGSRRLLEQSLELYRRLGHLEGVSSALFGLGVLARDLGDLRSARDYLTQSLAVGRDLGDVLCVALSMNALGTVEAMAGDLASGTARLEASLALFHDLRDTRGILFAMYHLAMCVLRRADPPRAVERLRESLQRARRAGDPRYTLYGIDGLAALAADSGDWQRAGRLFSRADRYREEIGHPWPPYLRDDRARSIAVVRAALPDPAYRALRTEGHAMSLDEAIAYALGEESAALSDERGKIEVPVFASVAN